MELKLLQVEELISSRYAGSVRPNSWDNRLSGCDTVRSKDNQVFVLWSSGGQSPPARGWQIVLRDKLSDGSYTWTLYGFADEAGSENI